MNIQINRLDYKNPTSNGGLPMLSSVRSFEEVTDINEIRGIIIGEGDFKNKAAAEEFAAKFPKSYGGRACTCYGNTITYYVGFYFNTFWTNKTTGDVNESAYNRRLKVINKIKAIL